MDNRIRPVETLILSGLAERFYQAFGIKLHFTASVDKKATISKMLGSNAKYPFAFATLSAFALDTERYSPLAMLRRGIASQSSHDNALAYRLSAIPTTSTFQIEFVSQDMREVMKFSKQWIMTSLQGGLKFTVHYGVADIDVSVEMDQDMQIPQRTDGVTEVNEFELTANVRLKGFHSKDKLDQIQAVTTIEVNGVVVSKDDYDALTQEGKDNVTVHLFKRTWNSIPGPDGSSNDPRDVGV